MSKCPICFDDPAGRRQPCAAKRSVDLADAAQSPHGVTEGPWSVPGQSDKVCCEGYTKNGWGKVVATVSTASWLGDVEPWANACFIAFARAWVPEAAAALTALSAERDALAAQVAELTRLNDTQAETITAYQDAALPPAADAVEAAYDEALRVIGEGQELTVTGDGSDVDWRYRARVARADALNAAMAKVMLARDAAMAKVMLARDAAMAKVMLARDAALAAALWFIAGVALSDASAEASTPRCVFVGGTYVCTTDRGTVSTGVCIQLVNGRVRCL